MLELPNNIESHATSTYTLYVKPGSLPISLRSDEWTPDELRAIAADMDRLEKNPEAKPKVICSLHLHSARN